MKKFALNVWNAVLDVVSAIKWPRLQAVINGGMYYRLREADHDHLRELLRDNYCIILTRRSCHFTTYTIAVATLVVQHKLPHFSHALMNVEGDLEGHLGYKLVEATSPGVHYSTFMEVFDCDSVAVLKPVGVTHEEWTKAMDYVKSDLGKHYDTLFDIKNDQTVSCVELVYWALKTLPDFEQRFPKLIKLIQDSKNLTPQMLYDCEELEVVFEVRR